MATSIDNGSINNLIEDMERAKDNIPEFMRLFGELPNGLKNKINRTATRKVIKGRPSCACCSFQEDKNVFEKLVQLKKCSRCKKVYYCGRECQKLHWKTHKEECTKAAVKK